jgi:hypothetical protein
MKNCGTHYEYICAWVDDLLIMGTEPMRVIELLKTVAGYKLKGVGAPEYYLGADFERLEIPEPVLQMGSKTYIDKCLETYKNLFDTEPTKQLNPAEPNDHPEIDSSPECGHEDRRTFQQLIGMLQWCITLGRYDLMPIVPILSRFRAAPRVGHLERAKRCFGYLKKYPGGAIKFRTDMPDHSNLVPAELDWTYVYGDVSEEIPSNLPTPMGKAVCTTTFVDANLMSCLITGRSMTGILHMLNKTPIDWFCKRQNTVETATYGSEFVAAKQATEQIMDIRYTLRMLGVKVEGPTYMFGDNKSVVDSASLPKCSLKKRHNALAFHRVREAIAKRIVTFIWISSKDNPSDPMTKLLPHSVRHPLLKNTLFWDD